MTLAVALSTGQDGIGRASASQDGASTTAVRRVDFRRAPELAGLVEEARAFANEMYPRVCALLLDEGAQPPRQFDLILRPIASGNHGEAHVHSGRIHLNSNSLTNDAARAERLRHFLVHEMAHLATVRSPGWRRWWTSPDAGERAWQESLADFARFRLLGANGPACAQCDAGLPSYADGYTCGGAFLLHLDDRHGTNLVRQLVRALRQRPFNEAFFLGVTGQPLERLWDDFQKTAAYLPSAWEALELREALGYVDGKPPRDVRQRFDRLVAERGDAFTKQALASMRFPGTSTRRLGITERVVLYTYLMQPGGPPERFVLALRERGQLPGVPAGAKSWSSSMAPFETMVSRAFPAGRVVVGKFEGDASNSSYHYAVRRASVEAPWVLDLAWRTDPQGNFVEQFPCR